MGLAPIVFVFFVISLFFFPISVSYFFPIFLGPHFYHFPISLSQLSPTGGYQNKKIGLKIKGLTFLRLFKRKTIGKYKEKPRKYQKIRGSLSQCRIFLFSFFAVHLIHVFLRLCKAMYGSLKGYTRLEIPLRTYCKKGE